MAKKPTKAEQALKKEATRQAGEPKTVPGGAPIEGRTNYTAPGKVKKLAKDLAGLADDMAEIRGEMGGLVTDATQNHHLHKKAFAEIRKQQKMSASQLHDYYTHRDYYEDITGLRDKAKTAPRFAGMEGNPADGAEALKANGKNGTGKTGSADKKPEGEKGGETKDNVTTFPGGAEARPH